MRGGKKRKRQQLGKAPGITRVAKRGSKKVGQKGGRTSSALNLDASKVPLKFKLFHEERLRLRERETQRAKDLLESPNRFLAEIKRKAMRNAMQKIAGPGQPRPKRRKIQDDVLIKIVHDIRANIDIPDRNLPSQVEKRYAQYGDVSRPTVVSALRRLGLFKNK